MATAAAPLLASGQFAVQEVVFHADPPPGYPPAPQVPGAANISDITLWVRRVVDVVNRTLSGKLNATLPITLAANATTTTIIDPRITAYSALLLTPLTAHAAAIAGSVYVSSQQNGQATFTHTNTAQIDQLFRAVIIG